MDRKTAVLISLGFEVIGVVIAAIWIGGILDEKYQWGGLGVTGGIIIGFVGWIVHLLVVVRQLDKDSDSGNTSPK